MRDIIYQNLRLSLMIGLMTAAFVGCGEGPSNDGPASLSSASVSDIEGDWTLSKVQDESVSPDDSAILRIVKAEANPQSLSASRQIDCSGSVNAVLNQDAIQLGGESSGGCFVDFPRSVEVNRSRISEALRGGAAYSLNADSTLTLQSSAGTLVFVKAQE